MIALIAGTGALPGVLARALQAAGRPVLICEMAGFPVTGTGDLPRLGFRFETLGSFLQELSARGVTEVCLAGAVRRPPVDPSLIDAATWPLVPRVQAALARGDDGALRELIAILEERGLAVRAAHEIAPDLLPPEGVLGEARPQEAHLKDVLRAEAVHAALAAADVGQACVVASGQVVALEAGPGTDWMLQSLVPPLLQRDGAGASGGGAGGGAGGGTGGGDPLTWAVDTASDLVSSWADWLTGPEAQAPRPPTTERAKGVARGGLLFKAPKAGQDRRVDLPAIGPETVTLAAAADLSAIVIAAGGVMVLDRAETVRRANRAGIALWVRPTES